MDNTNFACVHDKFSEVADYFTSVAAAIMIFNPHLFDWENINNSQKYLIVCHTSDCKDLPITIISFVQWKWRLDEDGSHL